MLQIRLQVKIKVEVLEVIILTHPKSIIIVSLFSFACAKMCYFVFLFSYLHLNFCKDLICFKP